MRYIVIALSAVVLISSRPKASESKHRNKCECHEAKVKRLEDIHDSIAHDNKLSYDMIEYSINNEDTTNY